MGHPTHVGVVRRGGSWNRKTKSESVARAYASRVFLGRKGPGSLKLLLISPIFLELEDEFTLPCRGSHVALPLNKPVAGVNLLHGAPPLTDTAPPLPEGPRRFGIEYRSQAVPRSPFLGFNALLTEILS